MVRCAPLPRAFSLIELLVVIGIITLVIAILIPVLSRVRTAAMNVVCAGRLRELTLASRMYCDEYKLYPEPLQHGAMDPSGQLVLGHAPHQISTTLLNELRPYLKFPEVDATTEASKLPPFVQCPFAEEQEVARGPSPSFFNPQVAMYYTGYAYLARLDEPPLVPLLLPASGFSTLAAPVVDQGRLLKPKRAAAAKDKRRAVLWADHVYRSELSGGFWQYTHARRGRRPGPLPLTLQDQFGLLGQHRAFTDGSVEWVGAGESGLEVAEPKHDSTAAFRTSREHWWF